MGRPLNQRVGQLLRDSQCSLRDPQKNRLGTKSLSTTNPPTTTLVSVVAAPTHIPCISHHPTHPLPTKSLRCQVSTAPQAIAPPLNTRACMTCAHVKFQEYSSCFFWYISLCKVFKTWNKGSDNGLGTLKNMCLGHPQKTSLKKSLDTTNPPTSLVSFVAAPTHHPCINHHPTHPFPTKSLRCQVSTAPGASAPPLSTWARMTCAHAKNQESHHVSLVHFLM